MNRQDLQTVMTRANRPVNDSLNLSAKLADRVHATPKERGLNVIASVEEVAALFRYQALQMNGEWDMEAVQECFDWLKFQVALIEVPPLQRNEDARAGLIEIDHSERMTEDHDWGGEY